jgi:hypothetical protein
MRRACGRRCRLAAMRRRRGRGGRPIGEEKEPNEPGPGGRPRLVCGPRPCRSFFSAADGVWVRRFGSLRPQEPRCARRAGASRGGGKRRLERVAGGHGRDLLEPLAVISRPVARPLLPMKRPREARRCWFSSSRATIPLKRRQRTERAVRWMTAATRPSKRPSSRHKHHPGRNRSLKVLPVNCSDRWPCPNPRLLSTTRTLREAVVPQRRLWPGHERAPAELTLVVAVSQVHGTFRPKPSAVLTVWIHIHNDPSEPHGAPRRSRPPRPSPSTLGCGGLIGRRLRHRVRRHHASRQGD